MLRPWLRPIAVCMQRYTLCYVLECSVSSVSVSDSVPVICL